MSFKAQIVADSISEQGHRITSMLTTFPRYILAEFNTHRMFSRNSASSRAIPLLRMIGMVMKNPFVPLKWMKTHKGMQGTDYFENKLIIALLRFLWLTARTLMVCVAWLLGKIGVTKQLANRLLEPFMWHTVLVTATEWENFFSLRHDAAADIHMQEIARLMLEAMNTSTPKVLRPGEWHMPFGDDVDEAELCRVIDAMFERIPYGDAGEIDLTSYLLEIATARCARTSYLTLGDNPVRHDYAADIKLHDRLSQSGHWSPFEHCARAMNNKEYDTHIRGRLSLDENGLHSKEGGPENGWCGNFRGWIQYRKTFENENRIDNRLIKH